jgi:hypothetical protein
MFKRSNVAKAMAAAALASAALAAPASAIPVDTFTIDSPNHEYQFGDNGSCSAGAAPAAGGRLDWRENVNQTTIAPRLDGDLCLQGTNGRYRMAVVYHDDDHNQVTRFASNPSQGNGSPLNAFAVLAGGPRVDSSDTTHVLVRIEEDLGGNNWVPRTQSVQYYP